MFLTNDFLNPCRTKTEVEYYFSDLNWAKDEYLRSLSDSDGFVAIENIMDFKLLKQICSDFETIRESLQTSEDLELSACGNRLRKTVASLRRWFFSRQSTNTWWLESEMRERELLRTLEKSWDCMARVFSMALTLTDYLGLHHATSLDRFDLTEINLSSWRCWREKAWRAAAGCSRFSSHSESLFATALSWDIKRIKR